MTFDIRLISSSYTLISHLVNSLLKVGIFYHLLDQRKHHFGIRENKGQMASYSERITDSVYIWLVKPVVHLHTRPPTGPKSKYSDHILLDVSKYHTWCGKILKRFIAYFPASERKLIRCKTYFTPYDYQVTLDMSWNFESNIHQTNVPF